MTTKIYEAAKLYEATLLYEASLTGDIQAKNALLHQEQLVLDKLSLTRLHIAAMSGFRENAIFILYIEPKLITALDFRRRTPLHLASAIGDPQMVQTLVWAKGGHDVCCFGDQDGLTPLHLAAKNEHVEVVKELVEKNPNAAKEILESGETILHMCVNNNDFESLKVLMGLWNEDELSRITDHCGNTLLHAAVINKQTQILNYLLRIPSIKANGNDVNKLGLTALDILDLFPRDRRSRKAREILMEAGVLRAISLRAALDKPIIKSTQIKENGFLSRTSTQFVNDDHHWIGKHRAILILAALVVAGVSLYSRINPRGGTISDATQNGICSLGNKVG